MRALRKKALECKDTDKINQFLINSEIGFLGVADEEYPYVVPLNYIWHKDSIYFHGANAGKKAELMQANPKVSFTVCEELGIMTSPVPAHTSTAYMSVMIFGQVKQIADWDEATEVMQKLLDKYVPGYFDRPLARSHVEKYRSKLGSPTTVYCLTPDVLTAKESPLESGRKFEAGMKARKK
ncbi:pyridoxamine 5'-phosphate oxidase family protein [Sporolactobacillus terrae]|uniref:pyridoxamine 5'-phosphate oxidase family protein n=1 Tax=Sporolactobacillus terrae TaxID=269673 RepID=UPI00048C52B6|nr:pyridoxamine 5'-phosphate oxidase family protein [Sporolactobacillus terrae]